MPKYENIVKKHKADKTEQSMIALVIIWTATVESSKKNKNIEKEQQEQIKEHAYVKQVFVSHIKIDNK